MGVPYATMSRTIMQLDSFVWTQCKSPPPPPTRGEMALSACAGWTWVMKRCQKMRWITTRGFLSADGDAPLCSRTISQITDRTDVHLHLYFVCASPLRENHRYTHTHTVVSCFPLLFVWLHAASLVQPVFERVIQKGRYGSCRLGQVGGQLLPPLYAPNLSLSPCCVKGIRPRLQNPTPFQAEADADKTVRHYDQFCH